MPEVDTKDARPRVCLVDDDPALLSALATLLEDEFEVIVARNGRDALRLARRDPPDLVILDVQMPDLDGFDVCRRLRNDPLTADVPVVFLTGQADEETEVRGLSAGADDFIAKPPRAAVVLARTRNLVRMKRQADQLRREARRDALTGLANRRHFTSAMRDELLRAKRQKRPLSVLMLDIDHFKAFNDRYGHLAGDGALARAGQILNALAKRPGDLAGRLGGEEFALLLPDTDMAGAMVVARRALDGFVAARIVHETSPTAGHLTCSVGVATKAAEGADSPRHRDTDVAPIVADIVADLLSRADDALYRAKRAGRNQALSEAEGEQPASKA